MKLHPKIKELYIAIQESNLSNVLSKDVIVVFRKMNATTTDAYMTLHLAYNVSLDDAEKFILDDGTLAKDEPGVCLRKMLIYGHYNGKDDNMDSDDILYLQL